MTLTAIDYILIVITALALITGGMKGFVRQAGSIAGLVCGVLACRFFGETVADIIAGHEGEYAAILRVICYAIVFIAVYVGISLLARLAGSILSAVKLRFLDRLAGAVFRALLWLLFVSLALNIYLSVCPDDKSKFYNNRPWRSFVTKLAPTALGYIVNQDPDTIVLQKKEQ